MNKKEFVFLTVGMMFGVLFCLMIIFLLFQPPQASAEQKQEDRCRVYYDKAKELAEKSARDLPTGITMDFDPRVAESNASIAYSQIYRNCKEYGE